MMDGICRREAPKKMVKSRSVHSFPRIRAVRLAGLMQPL
jgi:hypothetical protein